MAKIDSFVLNSIKTANLIYIYFYLPELLDKYLENVRNEHNKDM
jgi:hypothetical protein